MTGNENHVIAMKKRMAIVAVACCAIEADGGIDDQKQEVAVMSKNLAVHPLFKNSNYDEESIKTLIFKCIDSFRSQEALDEDLDSDDIADCRVQTVTELAKSLNHKERLSAFVIAAFTVNADKSIAFTEFLYLSALSKALDIYDEEKVQKILSCAQMNARVEYQAADKLVKAAANGDWEGIDTMFEN